MKNVDLKSMKDLNIVGFDLHYKDANGKMQVLKDGMIDIAKGSLAVKVNGKDINVVELLDTKSNISDAAKHAFLDTVISSPKKKSNENDEKKEKEKDEDTKSSDEKSLEDQEQAKKLMKLLEKKLQERTKEIEQLQKELEVKKETIEKIEEQQSEEIKILTSELEARGALNNGGQSTAEGKANNNNDNKAKEVKEDSERGAAPKTFVPPTPPVQEVRAGKRASPGQPTEEKEKPEPPVLEFGLSVQSDSGAKADLITNINNSNGKQFVEFKGSFAPLSKITLKLDGVDFKVTSDDTGNWLVKTDNFLPDGDYEVVAKGLAPDGMEITTTRSLMIDTVPPETPTFRLDVDFDSGTVGDFLTNQSTPRFVGTGEPGAELVITVNGVSYDTEVGVDGNWVIDISEPLPDGQYDVEAVSSDVAGNISLPAEKKLAIDSSIVLTGGLSIDSDSGLKGDARTNVKAPSFNGTGDEGDLVVLKIKVGEELLSYETAVDEDGAWRIGPIAQLDVDGSYSYTISSSDVAGNIVTLRKQFILDTAAPDFTGGLSATSDTGASAVDNLTKVNTPQFSGSGEVGAAVVLTIGGQTYNTTVGAGGIWAIDVSTPLTDGNKNYSLSATDLAGNVAMLGSSIVVDTVAPALSGGLSTTSDSGFSPVDKITKMITPLFSGNGEVGSAVSLTIGGQTYNTTVGAGGAWSIQVTNDLADGNQNYTLTGTDLAGNVTTLSGSITVDTSTTVSARLSSASDTGSLSNDNVTKDNTPSFNGTGEPNSAIELTIGGQTYTSMVSAVGTWSIDVNNPLADGNQNYSVRSTDLAGNVSTLSGSIMVDTLAPAFTGGLNTASDSGASATDKITKINTPQFSGTGEAGAAVALTIGGQAYSATVGVGGTWSIAVTDALADGSQNYTLTASDLAGNMNTLNGSITVDTTAPAFAGGLSAASDSGSSTSDRVTKIITPQFSGTGEVGTAVALTIAGQTYNTTVGAGGTWSMDLTAPLTDGSKSYILTGTDLAGNVSTLNGSITVDTVAPAFAGGLSSTSDSGSSVSDRLTKVTTPQFSGTGEPGASVTLTIGGQTYNTIVGFGGTWSVEVTNPLPDGNQSYSLISSDPAGNVSILNGSITVDTVAPAFAGGLTTASDSGSSTTDKLTKITTPQFSGNGEVGAAVVLSIGGQTYSTTVGAGGGWSVDVTKPLTDGNQSYSITGTDPAGNVTTLIGSITVDTSTTLTARLSSTSDTGIQSNDNLTKINIPSFNGTGEPNSAIELTIGGQTYNTTVSAGGIWSINVSNTLPDGEQLYSITSTDLAGNISTLNGSITVDTVAPLLTGGLSVSSDSGSSTSDGITKVNIPQFSGTGEVGAAVVLTIGGQTYKTTVGSAGTWLVDVTNSLTDGNQSYSLTATDTAGNVTMRNGSITVDTAAPVFAGGLSTTSDSGASATDNLTRINTPQFSGTGEAGASVVLTIGGQTYITTVGSGGIWSVEVTNPLTDGNQSYSLTATDTAGNMTTRNGSITVDTAAPAFAGGLSTASDSGSSTSDGITKVNIPQFSGTGEAGAAVALTIGGQTYNTTVGAGGSWSIAVTTPLADSNTTYSITGTDLAGNVSTLNGSLVIDTVAPAFTGGLSAASDSGRNAGDNVTRINTPQFSGTGEVGAVVVLSIGGQAYNTSVGAGGTWSIEVMPPLLDGNKIYTLTSTDLAGNVTTLNGSITVDTVAPAFAGGLSNLSDSGASNTDNVSNINTPQFSGTGEAGAAVTLTIGGQSYNTTVNAGGTWSVNVTNSLADGSQAYNLIATDLAGNVSTLGGSITIDTAAPAFAGGLSAVSDSGTSATDRLTKVTNPEFSGTGEVGTAVALTIGGQTYNTTVGAGGTWSIEVANALTDGNQNYTITGSDLAGNVTTLNGSITVDTAAPAFTGALSTSSDSGSSGSDTITKINNPQFSGTGEVGAAVVLTIGGQTYATTVGVGGNWSINVTNTLADGNQSYSLTATDPAGNVSALSGSITIDTAAPAFAGGLNNVSDSGVSASDRLTKVTTPQFVGTGEPGAVVVLTIGGHTYNATVGAGGSWFIAVSSPLSDGNQNYSLTGTDVAGNVTTLTGSITVDTSTTVTARLSAATDTGGSSNDNITKDNTPSFNGTGEPGSTIELTVGGQSYATTVDTGGAWSINVNNALADGSQSYSVTSTDLAGNISVVSGSIIVDTTAPAFAGGLSAASDSGTSSADRITKIDTPDFSGTGEVGTAVALTIGGQTYNTTVGAGGIWSIELTNPLADGNQLYTLTGNDLAGNVTVRNGSITVDTAAPAFTGGLSSLSDSGTSSVDNVTRINNPEFSGTGEVGTAVALTIGGQFYNTTVGAGGAWSIDVTTPLTDGNKAYVLTATDLAGNVTTRSGSITVDTVAPVFAGGLSAASDSGSSATDRLTKVATPQFSGTGEVGTAVALTIGDQTYNTTVGPGGTWLVEVTNALSNGNQNFTLTGTDLAGNVSSLTSSISVDTSTNVTARLSAASDTGGLSNDNITNDNTPSFNGTGEPGSTIALSIGGQTYNTAVSVGGTWSIDVGNALADGNQSYSVTSTDLAGNTSSVTGSITVDTAAPPFTGGLSSISDSGSSTTDRLTKVTTPQFSGTGEVGAAVALTIGGQTYTTTVIAGGTWSMDVTTPLSDGNRTYVLTSTDLAGNVNTLNGSITVDNLAPVFAGGLSSSSDSGGSTTDRITNINTPEFSGAGEAGAAVALTIGGQTYNTTVGAGGAWSIDVSTPLSDGNRNYSLMSTDAAGNVSTLSGNITVDKTAPAFAGGLSTASDSGSSNTDRLTKINTPQFSGVGEVGAAVALSIGGQTYSTTVSAGGTWSIDVTNALSSGNQNYILTGTDLAGNVTTLINSIAVDTTTTVTARLSVASDTGSFNNDNITKDNTPSFNGTGEPSSFIELIIGGQTYTTTVGAGGTWSIDVTTGLADGNQSYSVTSTDLAGNASSVSGSITVDTASPAFVGGLSAISDSGSSATDRITKIDTPQFSGTGEVGTAVVLSISGQTYNTTIGAGGTWLINVTTPLTDGNKSYSLTGTDLAGNVTALNGSITVDSLAPVFTGGLSSASDTGTSATDRLTKINTPQFSGTGEEGEAVVLNIGGATYHTTVGVGGTWSIEVSNPLTDGNKTYTLTGTDIAGNVSTVSGNITVDTTLPVLTGGLSISSDSGNSNTDKLTKINTPQFSGTGEPGASLVLSIGGQNYSTTINAGGTWAIGVTNTLADGNQNYTLTATDAAGNSTTLNSSITVDTTAPEFSGSLNTASDSGSSAVDKITKITTPQFIGTGEVGAAVALTLGGQTYNTTVGAGGTWSINVSNALADGNQSYSLFSTDLAGNVSTLNGSFTVDTSTMATGRLSVTSDSGIVNNDHVTNDSTPSFNGTGEPSSTIELTIGGQTYTTTVSAGGTWSINVNNALADGDQNYSITSTDLAGNTTMLNGSITLDTVLPAFLGDLSAASDSGTSSTDRITKITTPQFSGTGEVGTAVALMIGGQTYTTTVGSGGNWSINVSNALADGNQSYTLTGTDLAGNATVLTGSITVDTSTTVTARLSAASDTGSLSNDNLTNDKTPGFNGTAEPNSAVQLTIGGHIYSTTASAGGTWSIQINDELTEGNQSYSVTSTDIAGNVSTVSGTITIDTVSPSLAGGLSTASDSGTSTADRITKVNTPQFSGTGEVGTQVALTLGDETYTTSVGAGGTWSINVTNNLADGNQNYTLTGTDAAGNVTTLTNSITVDTSTTVTARLSAATNSSTLNNDNITNDTTPGFNGTGEVGAAVALTIGGQTYNTTVGAGGTWSIASVSALADGNQSYSVTSTDIAGNTSTVTGSITVDTAAPEFAGGLSVVSDSGTSTSDRITKINTPQFSGTGEVGAAVALTIGSQTYATTVDAGGTWSIDVATPLADGNRPYTLTATDTAGNVTTLSNSITVDTVGPALTGGLSTVSDSGSSAADRITKVNTPSFNGTGEVGVAIALTIGGQTYNTTVGAGGTWSINVSNTLTDGNQNYTLTGTDTAGNVTTLTNSITVDTAAPAFAGGLSAASDSGSSAADRITKINTPQFSGAGEVGAAVALTIGSQTYTTTVGAGGTWSLNVTNALGDGNQNYTLTGTDTAGNVTTLTNSITVDTSTAVTARLSAASDSGTLNNDNITNDNTPGFNGTGEVGAEVALTIGGQTYTTTVGTGGTWSIDAVSTLANDNYAYTVTSTDIAGNTSTVTGNTTIDTIAPALTGGLSSASDSGSSAADRITRINTPQFSGTGEVGAAVALTLGGETYTTTVGAGGTWSINVANTLADGNQNYIITGTDSAGNVTTLTNSITVDTAAPSFAGGLSSASDSGSSASDRITKINTPQFSGTGEVGAAVALAIGGEIYATTVGAGGTWSLNVTNNLADGNQNYILTGTDTAGNVSTLTNSITVDTAAPAFAGGLSSTSDSGSSAADRITKINTPQFSGTGEVGAAVALTIGGQTYNTTVGAGGAWSIEVTTPLTDGNRSYTLTGTDTAGNLTTLAGSITVDTAAPAFAGGLSSTSDSGGLNNDNITNDNTPAFNGTGEVGAAVVLTIGGQTYATTVVAGGTWSVTASTPLTDGNKSYSITSTDIAGNVSTLSGNITVDTVSPTFAGGLNTASDTGISATDRITKVNTPQFSGTGEVGTAVALTIGGETYTTTVGAGGTWSINVSIPLTDGNKGYSLIGTDTAGNLTTLTGSITVDTAAPVLTGGLSSASDSGSSASDRITKVNTPQFSGTGEVGAAVALTIGGQTYNTTVGAGGTWSINVTNSLADGNQNYTLTGTDTGGNVTTLSSSIAVDTAAPVLIGGLSSATDTGSSAADRITKINTPQFSGTGEVGAAVALTIGGQTYNTTVGAGGAWSIEVATPLTDGNRSYTLTGTDTAGNLTTLAGSITVDTSTTVTARLAAASDSGVANNDDITNDNTPSFNGTGEVGAAVALVIGGQTYNTTVGAGGTWAIDVNNALADGSYSYSVTSTDIAGNMNTAGGSIIVDTVLPAFAGDLSVASDSGSSATDKITKINTPQFNGTGEVGAAVALTIGGQIYNTTVGAGGTWSINVSTPLTDGNKPYTLTGTDLAGNISSLGGSITVDTTNSVTARLSAASDSGVANNDNITNDNTPSFNGTGEVGAAVHLTIGGQTYSTTVGAGGTWVIDAGSALSNGNYAYTVTSTDSAGNVSTASGSITVDTVAPVLTGGLSTVSDSGSSAADRITKVNTPSFNGTGEVGAAVALTIGGQTYNTTVGAGGTWSINVSNTLTDGNQNYTLTGTDTAGNVTTLTNSITVDTAAPAFAGGLSAASDSGSSAADRITKINTPQFSGAGEVGAAVALTIGSQTYTTTVGAGGTWSIDVTTPLAEGNRPYTLTATDTAGNVTTLTNSVTVDTSTAVTARLSVASDSGTLNNDNITNDNTPGFNGTGEVGAEVALTIGGQTYTTTVGAGGTWSIASVSTLANGNQSYSVTSTDIAGNTNTVSGNITVDTVAPAFAGGLSASSDSGISAADRITKINTPHFSGTGEVGTAVVLTIGEQTYTTTVGAGGTWSVTASTPLSEGNKPYTITGTDLAGNQTSLSGSITVDTTAPVLTGGLSTASDTGSSATDRVTKVTTPQFTGTGETGAAVALTLGGQTYNTTVDSGGTWSINVTTPLTHGNKPYTLTGTDAAGNITTLSNNIVVDVQVAAPVARLEASKDTGASNSDSVTKNNLPAFSGTAEAGASIFLTINGQQLTASANGAGNWSIQTPTPFTDGNYAYSVFQIDPSGNQSAEATGSITIDTVPIVLSNIVLLDAGNNQMTNWVSNQPDNLTLQGSTEPNGTVTVLISGRPPAVVTANGSGLFTYDMPDLNDSNYTITVSVPDDLAGNSNSFSRNFLVDKTVSLTGNLDALYDTGSSQNDKITNVNTPLFSGASDPNATVTIKINGVQVGVVTASPSGTWQYLHTSPLADGTYTYEFSAVDTLGNSTQALGTNVTGAIVIDTSAPVFTAQLSPDSDTGTQGDKITNDRELIYRGLGEAGSTITLQLDGKTITTQVSQNGTWSITTSTLNFGQHAVTLTATDVAGNTRTITDQVTILVDFVQLAANLREVSDTATKGDGITSNTAPFLDGIATPTSTITVEIRNSSNVLIGTKTAQTDFEGKWSVQLQPDGQATLGDGEYTYKVTAVRDADTQVLTKTVVIDTVASTLTHALSNSTDSGTKGDTITNSVIPEIIGKTEPNASLTLNIAGKVFTTKADLAGDYSFALTSIPDGTHTYTVTVSDPAGNVSGYIQGGNTQSNNAATGTITLDRQAPIVTANLLGSSDSGMSSTDGITSDNTPTFTGTISGQFSEFYLTINNVNYNITPAGNGSWTLTLPALNDGAYNYAVVARDLSDNLVVLQKNIQIKTDIEFTTQLDNDTGTRDDDFLTNDNTLSFNGQTEPGNRIVGTLFNAAGTVQLGQVEVTSNLSGAYNLAFLNVLANGSYKVTFNVSDAAGNTFYLEETVIVDTVGQPLTFQMNSAIDTGENTSDGITKEKDVGFNGTGEPGSIVELTLLNSSGATVLNEVATVNSNGILTFQFSNLADGNYTIRSVASDNAGNSIAVADYNFQIITAAPVLTWRILEDANNDAIVGETELNGGRLTFDGTGNAGHTITVLIGGQEYITTVTGAGTWRITTPPLPDFKYPFQITAEDVAGNTTVVNSQVIQDSGLQVVLELQTDSFYSYDEYTNINQPIYRITTEAGADVQLTLTGPNGYSYSTSFKQPSVVYDWTLPHTLADGSYSISVRVQDQGLNVRTVNQSLRIDTVVSPQAEIEIPNSTVDGNGVYKVSDSRVFIEGPVNWDVDRVYVSVNNGQFTQNDYDLWGQNTRFSVPLTLPNGLHNVQVTFVDGAGNHLVKNYQIDVKDGFSIQPTVEIEDFNTHSGIWYGNPENLILSGQADPGLVMAIEIDGNELTTVVGPSGNWSIDLTGLDLLDGPHILSVSTADQYGNQFSGNYTLIADSTPPTSTFVANSDLDPSADQVLLNQKTATIQGQASRHDQVEVKLNGTLVYQTTVGTGGLWSYNLQHLTEGQNNLLVTIIDRAGNQSVLSKSINVDTTAPAPSVAGLSAASDTGSSNSDRITKTSTPQFAGTGEIGATVTLQINGNSFTNTLTTVVDQTGNWLINIQTPLADGAYTYNVSIADVAGNSTPIATNQSLVIDNQISGMSDGLTDATDTGLSNNDFITNNNTPVFEGTGNAGDTVLLTFSSLADQFTATVNQDGQWSISLAGTPLADGEYTYTLTSSDTAGNQLDLVTSGYLKVDTQAMASAGTSSFTTSDTTPQFTGTLSAEEEGARVDVSINGTIDTYTTWVDSGGNWSLEASTPVAVGDYTYEVTVTDVAGNTHSEQNDLHIV